MVLLFSTDQSLGELIGSETLQIFQLFTNTDEIHCQRLGRSV
jgi:hypothetical protein